MSSMEAAMSWPSQYLSLLSAGLERLYVNGRFSDTTIHVGMATFKCHRAVMSAVSPYFDAMYSSGMKESLTGTVRIEGFDADIISNIISFIYTGSDIVNDDNAEEVLKASALLQIEFLQHRCEQYLSRSLCITNCVARWRLAHTHNCLFLQHSARVFVLEHYTQLSTSEVFFSLEVDELISLLEDDDLHAPSEEYVADSALRWVLNDEAHRCQHLPRIFRNIRFCLTRPQYLMDLVRKKHLLRNCVDALQAIDAAKNFHLLPSQRHDFSSEVMSHRKFSQMEDVLVVISGGETPRPPYLRTKEVFAYSFTSNVWHKLAALPNDPGIEFASCVYENDIFVTGGGSLQTCFMRYMAKKNKWIQVRSKLKKGRRRHAMVACGKRLYAIGGFNAELEEGARVQNSIEEYELDSGEWTEVDQLIQPASSVSATAHGDQIFVYGGEKSDRTDSCVVQCYHTVSRAVSVVASLPVNCKLSRAVVCDQNSYLVLFDGQVIRHSPEEGSTKIIGQINEFDRVHFGLVHRRGVLYVLGGQRVGHGPSRVLCDAMITFNIRTNETAVMSDRVPTPRLLDTCAKITIEKKFLKQDTLQECSLTGSSTSL